MQAFDNTVLSLTSILILCKLFLVQTSVKQLAYMYVCTYAKCLLKELIMVHSLV